MTDSTTNLRKNMCLPTIRDNSVSLWNHSGSEWRLFYCIDYFLFSRYFQKTCVKIHDIVLSNSYSIVARINGVAWKEVNALSWFSLIGPNLIHLSVKAIKRQANSYKFVRRKKIINGHINYCRNLGPTSIIVSRAIFRNRDIVDCMTTATNRIFFHSARLPTGWRFGFSRPKVKILMAVSVTFGSVDFGCDGIIVSINETNTHEVPLVLSEFGFRNGRRRLRSVARRFSER